MPVLWPLFTRRREPFTLGETLSRAGCGLLLEEKNPDRRQLPNVERRFSRRQIGSQFPPCLAAFLKEYG